jgi:hypothetical protein
VTFLRGNGNRRRGGKRNNKSESCKFHPVPTSMGQRISYCRFRSGCRA